MTLNKVLFIVANIYHWSHLLPICAFVIPINAKEIELSGIQMEVKEEKKIRFLVDLYIYDRNHCEEEE